MSGAASPVRVARQTPVPVITPGLKKLLFAVFGLFALLAINSSYLGSVTFIEWLTEKTIQNYFYQLMFLGHLVLGLLLIPPVVVYGILHMRRASGRPNRRAVRVGYALFAVAMTLLISGLLLTRGIPLIEVRDPDLREGAYWIHLIAPIAAAWLFVIHRLAGPRINWRLGRAVTIGAVALSVVLIAVQSQDPRRWNAVGPEEGAQYFLPSLSRTASGDFIPARALMQDQYCARCHEDVHEGWSNSAHRFASFNNPAYLFSVRNTRRKAMERDGSVRAARFCAGCHDPVPFFSGAFDDPEFDDVGHPMAHAGITCTACHAITNVNSPRGNADYTIEEPLHYPFAYSTSEVLAWINETLVKAKPAFHRKTFLKPLHREATFCGACHKVHLPEELNRYRWLRGQNHYDSYLLSGVSGHGILSFYYPEEAEGSCNGCHMPAMASEDFGARHLDDSGELKVHDHQFASANTAIPMMVGMPESVIEAHRQFLRDALRVDIFGVREGGTVDGRLYAPLRPALPVLEPGRTYLLEIVLRTLSLGHSFTQGTADSNQVWLDVGVIAGGEVIGRSGATEATEARVDPWSHFVNAWVLDREGRRIDRRNAEDIFTSLYNNQIPPGAADVVHYRLSVPETVSGSLEVRASLKYRKFDSTYLRHIRGEAYDGNDLPVTVIASDSVVLPVGSGARPPPETDVGIEAWERWNDYGIGLFRKRGAGQLRQAERAFTAVETHGRPAGALNLARVYLREGRLEEADAALRRAASGDPPAYPWSVTYFTAVLDRQNGFLDEAIDGYRTVVETRFREARTRGFDFAQDYRLLNELAATLLERSKLERGASATARRDRLLTEAEALFREVLRLDPENVKAHWGLAQTYGLLGRDEDARRHRQFHARYKTDDNARDRAIAAGRRADPAANHAAEPVVIYDLQRSGAYGLPERFQRTVQP